MATNATEMVAERRLAEEVFRPKKAGREPAAQIETEDLRLAERGGPRETGQELALAPLVDKVAYGLARVLVVAMQELENHIAAEARKVGDTVGQRLDTLQASFQDLTEVVSEQRSMGLAVQGKCGELAAATASLQESDARQEAELAALRTETRGFSASVSERIDVFFKELGVQQEDIAAVKSTLCEITSRVDTVAERLDRQAEALRSMYSAYAQRETALEQLVDGLARLKAYPAPAPANRL